MNEQYSNSVLVTSELTETWIYHVHYGFFWLEDFCNLIFPVYFERIFQYATVSPQNKYQKKLVFPFPEEYEKRNSFSCIVASLKVIEEPYGLAFLLLDES